MKRTRRIIRLVLLALLVVVGNRLIAQQGKPKQPPQQQQETHQHDAHNHEAEQAAVQGMAPGHHHEGPHIRMTQLRTATPQDQQRAGQLVRTLRGSLEKYKDYREALADGYEPFLENLPLPEHHFTNYRVGFEAAFQFDPARPTSLLYRRTKDGWELRGAMYTAPRNASEDRLNARVPLSVARWHAHINICLPPRDRAAQADWKKFGPAGSIATQEACQAEGGRWIPQLFGWMVHVYPWEESAEKVWGH